MVVGVERPVGYLVQEAGCPVTVEFVYKNLYNILFHSHSQ